MLRLISAVVELMAARGLDAMLARWLATLQAALARHGSEKALVAYRQRVDELKLRIKNKDAWASWRNQTNEKSSGPT